MRETEKLDTGVSLIDKGHMDLVTMLKNLRAAIKAQVCRYTIENTLALLEEYVEVSFCKEEHYMKHYGYPDYVLHKAKHEDFVVELRFLREELRNIRALGLKGSYELSVETVQLIVDWIADHVLKDDKKLGECMKQNSYGQSDSSSSPCGSADSVIDGLVAICSICQKIRGKKGLWKQKENFRGIPSDIIYSHSICPECLQVYYADLFAEKR